MVRINMHLKTFLKSVKNDGNVKSVKKIDNMALVTMLDDSNCIVMFAK